MLDIGIALWMFISRCAGQDCSDFPPSLHVLSLLKAPYTLNFQTQRTKGKALRSRELTAAAISIAHKLNNHMDRQNCMQLSDLLSLFTANTDYQAKSHQIQPSLHAFTHVMPCDLMPYALCLRESQCKHPSPPPPHLPSFASSFSYGPYARETLEIRKTIENLCDALSLGVLLWGVGDGQA